MSTTFYGKRNNAKSTITNNPLASGGLSITVASSTGGRFPAATAFLATIWDAVTYADPFDDSNMEIVKCDSVSGDTVTVNASGRGFAGTSAVSHPTGSAFRLLIMKEHADQWETAINTLEAASVGTYTAPTSVASTVWKGIGSDPAIGNGTWSASYIQVGKLLYFTFSMIAGSTTTFGTGSWFINLPVANVLTTSVSILLFDNSTSSSYRALAAISGGQIYPWYYADGSTQTVTVTAPFSWAVNDYFTATAIYHVA